MGNPVGICKSMNCNLLRKIWEYFGKEKKKRVGILGKKMDSLHILRHFVTTEVTAFFSLRKRWNSN